MHVPRQSLNIAFVLFLLWLAQSPAAVAAATNAVSLDEAGTNYVTDIDATQDVMVDMMIQPARWYADDPRRIDEGVRFAVRFNTNGHMNVWCRVFDGEDVLPPDWLEIQDTHVEPEKWVRLTVIMEPAADGLYDYFKVLLNGKAASHFHAFERPAGDLSHIATHNGQWFLSAALRGKETASFGFSGAGLVDKVTVTNQPATDN
jgi:hypothetical protein